MAKEARPTLGFPEDYPETETGDDSTSTSQESGGTALAVRHNGKRWLIAEAS